jgi:hypothetical protein
MEGVKVNLGTYFSSVAAALAAVFAGLNLYVSGRRQHRQWARQALVESLVEYMNASFDVSRACSRISRLRSEGASLSDLQALREEAEDTLHKAQLPIMTRLRMLCPPEVADAAQVLHAQDHVRLALVFKELASEDLFKNAKEARREARISMINEARAALSLPRNARIPTDDEDPETRAMQLLDS